MSSNSKLPFRVYTPESEIKNPLQLLHESWAGFLDSRGLAWQLMMRDFKAQYRQSYAGYLWAFLPPLFASGTFLILQSGNVINTEGLEVPYAAFVFIGTILWQIFVDSLNNPSRSFSSAKGMMTKINFPREAIILTSVGTSLLNVGIRMIVLIPVLLWFRFPFNASVLLFPVGVLALVLLGTSLGLLLSMAGSLYHDITRGMGLFINFWMFLTPVVIPDVREGLLGVIMTINPVTHILATTRDWLTGGTPTYLVGFYLVTVISFILLFIGLLLFRLVVPRLIERMGM